VTLFEQRDTLGGVWSPARRYPGVRLQTKRDYYCFSDFPMPGHYPEFPSGQQVYEYLCAYAKHFQVDQAIEVPLPDEIGRGKLVRLYGSNLALEQAVVDEAVRRTEGVSAAFIKELMRRLAQGSIARDGGCTVTSADIEEALNDMLFEGGRLNVKLLGGAREMEKTL